MRKDLDNECMQRGLFKSNKGNYETFPLQGNLLRCNGREVEFVLERGRGGTFEMKRI